MNIRILFLTITFSLLAACNGGGGDSDGGSGDSNTTTDTLTGSFIDSPVKGLKFETPTQSGLTNNLGEFTYQAGEQVTFHIGGTQLGITPGASTITPFSLFGIIPLTNESEIINALAANDVNSYDRAINLAILLQTLDTDGNPENGIDLGDSHSDLKDYNISLRVKARLFEQQSALRDVKSIVGVSQTKSLSNAIQHIYDTLGIEVKSSLPANYTATQNRESKSIGFGYDTNGNLASISVDTDNDGDKNTIQTYDYDANGNLTTITNSATQTVETRDYDSNNNLLSRLTNNETGDNSAATYRYTNNKVDLFSIDQNADGSVDASTQYEYNAQGDVAGYEIDRNGDGETDAITAYTYTSNTLSSYSEDSDNDGTPDITINYTYDTKGNRTSQSVTSAKKATPNTKDTFEYDAQNNPSRYEQDRNLDGTADYIEGYTYDNNNNRTVYKRDLDADGNWDSITYYSYDINGNRIRMIEDSDANGLADKVWNGTYEAAILDRTWDVILSKL
jgi:YD repeat-containing protein